MNNPKRFDTFPNTQLIYGMVFPIGLLMVILSGADLFTGNTAVVTTALIERKVGNNGLGLVHEALNI